MKLNYRILGNGHPLVVLHGVFGSSDNWQTVGKVFAEEYKVFLVDQRNHGNSPHSDDFDYEVMADDIIELMNNEDLAKAHVLGHSMGGKVAMHLATRFPERIDKLIVVDIAPKYYPPHHQQIFEGFNSINLKTLKSRKDADDQMALVINSFGIRQFILKNLTRDEQGHFKWKLNVPAIEKAVDKVGQGLESEVAFSGKTLFIAGGKSDYILPADHEHIRLLFPEAQVETIKEAGHWVHAERPQELSEMVLNFLK
ncbi:MAG: alpha/beta fold hydrolase [Cyclobacteriaceae bacterium]